MTGDMGIGNTTASAALIAALCGRSPEEVTGRGTGIDDRMLARKVEVVRAAVGRVGRDADPFDVLTELGGLEIAGLAGFMALGEIALRHHPLPLALVLGAATLRRRTA